MFRSKLHLSLYLSLFLFGTLFLNGCDIIKQKVQKPVFPSRLETAEQQQLKDEINNLAKVGSMRAKMYVQFEDNSFAEVGVAEKYRRADGSIVVERPAKILMKIQAPVAGFTVDIAQMTSDGDKFRIAILQDGGSGKNKKFITGTNNADYSQLREAGKINDDATGMIDRELLKRVNVFTNIRPQHFTEAILTRPVSDDNIYVQSEFFQEEYHPEEKKRSPLYWKVGAYYFLDELKKNAGGNYALARRFWFDRVGDVRLTRLQIFDDKGELDSDITYGATAKFTEAGNYTLPQEISVTRPKEKYKMKLTYQDAASVEIGEEYPASAFVLENTKNLPEVDLDKKLQEVTSQKSAVTNSSPKTQ